MDERAATLELLRSRPAAIAVRQQNNRGAHAPERASRLMDFCPQLQPGILRRRYKRFLADIVTDAGEPLTIHCPNTGAMTGCDAPGSRIWYSRSPRSARKYPHT